MLLFVPESNRTHLKMTHLFHSRRHNAVRSNHRHRPFRNLVLPELGKVSFLVFLLFLNASKNFEKSFERRASGFLRCCCSPFSFDSILFFRFSIWIVLMSDNIWREREIWEMERGGEIDVKKELCGWSDFFPVRTMERRREASRDLQLVGRESIG